MVCRHTLLLSLLHLLVDGICACGVMMMSNRLISDMEVCATIVLYDVLAFGTQPLTGRWVDKNDNRPLGLKLAVALLLGGALVSALFASLTILIAVTGAVLLGMGNSFFHVYGGRYVAVASHNDIRAMGVFVSTGAVGLAIGIGFNGPILLTFFLLAFMLLSFFHLRSTYGQDAAAHSEPSPIHSAPLKSSVRVLYSVPILYLSSLMLVVTGRAFIGEAAPSLHISVSSIGTPLTLVGVSVIVMLGKAAGGFLSKRWGVRNVFVISMLLSSVAFLMCPWNYGFVLLTLFLINLSMPCTLYLATKAVPGREGWTFGLLAMALLPGFLLGNAIKDHAICQALVMPLMATILLESLLLFYFLRERRWQVLAASVLFNILTNVPLNAFMMAYRVTSPLCLVGLECLVVVVEFMGYWLILHDRYKAFKYSLLCNIFSAAIGYLSQLFFIDYLAW